jgi:hypothetical protein
MCKLKPILQKWLEDADANTGQPHLSANHQASAKVRQTILRNNITNS